MKKGAAEPSSTQKFIEEYRAWIVFLIVLPISFVVRLLYLLLSVPLSCSSVVPEDVVEKMLYAENTTTCRRHADAEQPPLTALQHRRTLCP